MQLQKKSVLALMTTLIIIVLATWALINYKSNTQKYTRAKLVYERIDNLRVKRV